MTDVVGEILEYAESGVAVLPLHVMKGGACTCRRSACSHPAKHPITRNGKDDASTDRGVISEWLARYPGCNWGLRPPTGVVVLDVDPRNDGDVELRKLEQQHGTIPTTLTAQTGSGGLHLWLSHTGFARGKLCTGVDVKTNAGYVVAPPSVHACGGRYFWLDLSPAAYAPEWVVDLLMPPVRNYPVRYSGSIDNLVQFVAASTEGDRNNRLYWAACRARDAGADPTPLLDAAARLGLERRAVEATVESAFRTSRKAG